MATVPGIDPVTKGLRLLLTATGGASVLDVTVPGGIGWKMASSHRWVYRNKIGFQGITSVTVAESSSTPGRLQVRAQGKGLSLLVPPASLPLTVTVVVDAPLATTGQCGEIAFTGPAPTPACKLNGTATRLVCK